MRFLTFSMEAVRHLTEVGEAGRPRRLGRPARRVLAAQQPTAMIHRIEKIPVTGVTKKPQKRCRVCFRHGVRKMCAGAGMDCPENPGLCPGQCFNEFHNTVNPI